MKNVDRDEVYMMDFSRQSDSSNVPVEKYDSVIVLGSEPYRNTLRKLFSPLVKVIIKEQLTAEIILHLVRNHDRQDSESTLWILTTGIYAVCECQNDPHCKSCSKPLKCIHQCDNIRSEAKIATEVQDILFDSNKVCMAIQDELGKSGKIIIVPPIPATIVQESLFRDHKMLHRLCERYNTTCATDRVLFQLHIFFNILCDAWTSLACEWLPQGQQFLFQSFQDSYRGKNLVSIKNEDSYDHVESGWLTMMRAVIMGLLNIDDVQKIFSTSDEPSCTAPHDNKISVSTVKCVSSFFSPFSHCVVIGSSAFLSNLHGAFQNMPVSFLARGLDLDRSGLDILNEEKRNYPENTLYIFVRGVSEIAESIETAPKCKEACCHDPLCVFVLKNKDNGNPEYRKLSNENMMKKVVQNAVNFAESASSSLCASSSVFLSPVIPVGAYFGGLNSSLTHSQLHDLADKDPYTPILSGTSKEWLLAVEDLEEKWMRMIMDTIDEESSHYKALKEHFDEKIRLLFFTTNVGIDSRLVAAQERWAKTLHKLVTVLLGLEGGHGSREHGSFAESQSLSKTIGDFSEASVTSPAQNQSQASLLESSGDQLGIGFQSSNQPSTGHPSKGLLGVAPPGTILGQAGHLGIRQQYYGFNMSVSYTSDANSKQRTPQPLMAINLSPPQASAYMPTSSRSKKRRKGQSQIIASEIDKPMDVPKIKSANCQLTVKNVNNSIKHDHIRAVMEAFGSVLKLNIRKSDNKPCTVNVKFNNTTSAKRGCRILNFLKVLGKNSQAEVIGQTPPEKIRELQQEDRMIIPLIQDIIAKMQKEKAQVKQVSIVAKSMPIQPAKTSSDPSNESLSGSDSIAPKTEHLKTRALNADKPVIDVKVSNTSEFVSTDVVKELMIVCGSLGEKDDKKGIFICQVQDAQTACQMVTLMDNFRLPDVRLKVDVDRKLLTSEFLHVRLEDDVQNQVNVILKNHNDDLVSKLRESLSKDVNYYTFKTQMCSALICKSPDLCHNYHNFRDRRRSPITCRYSAQLCGSGVYAQCSDQKKCCLSHTATEQRFHMLRFRATLCEDAVKQGICTSHRYICAKAHPETPEMFFHHQW